jgi:hypothetical protein
VCPLWREDGSVVYNCCWPSPAQSFSGLSPVGLVAIFYWLIFETSLFVASYDSQDHDGGIRPRLHTGLYVYLLFRHSYIVCAPGIVVIVWRGEVGIDYNLYIQRDDVAITQSECARFESSLEQQLSWFRLFEASQGLSNKSQDVTSFRPGRFPYKQFPVNYLSPILPYDAAHSGYWKRRKINHKDVIGTLVSRVGYCKLRVRRYCQDNKTESRGAVVLVSVNAASCVRNNTRLICTHISAFWASSDIVHSLLAWLLLLYIGQWLHLMYCTSGFVTLRCIIPVHVFY